MATRIYLPSSGTPAISNATFATWTETTGADRLRASTSRGSTAMTDKTQARTASTANSTWLDRQYIVGPLAAQTFGASTVKGTIRALESAINDNVDAMRLSVRIVAPDGTTFRGTIYGPTNSTVAELNTTLRAKRLATGGATTSVTATEGDYLVIEIGATATTGGTTISTSINYGDNSATDLGDNETDTAANNPFVEFAANMKFLQRGWGQAQAKIKAVNVNAFGQTQAQIKAVNVNAFGQAQAQIINVNAFGQAQASIKAFDVNAFGQAQASILGINRNFAQATVQIDTGIYTITDTFTRTNASSFGSTDNSLVYTETTTTLVPSTDGSTGIMAPTSSTGGYTGNLLQFTTSKQTFIKLRVQQTAISTFISSITLKLNTNSTSSDRVSLNTSTNFGKSLRIDLKDGSFSSLGGQTIAANIYYWVLFVLNEPSTDQPSRARAKFWEEGTTEPGWMIELNSSSSISSIKGYASVVISTSAQNFIIDDLSAGPIGWTESGQAQTKIKAFNVTAFGQALASINTVSRTGQTQAKIIYKQSNSAQAQAYIVSGISQYGQAQANIKSTYSAFGQSQAKIIYNQNKSGQAQTQIGSFNYGLALAKIDTGIYSIVDTFTRTASDWGSTDNGLLYTTTSGTPTLSTNGSEGVNTTSNSFQNLKNLTTYPQTVIRVKFKVSVVATGDFIRVFLDYDLTGFNKNNYIQINLPSTTNQIVLFASDGSISFTSNTTSAVVTINANTYYNLLYEKNSTNTRHYSRAKLWLDGATEPDWQLIQAVSVPKTFTGAGAAIWFNSDTGAKTWTLDEIYASAGWPESGQAQASIKQIYYGLGQGQADIKAIGNGFGQTQADIKSIYSVFGQSNADILAQNYGLGQAQAQIKTTYRGLAQAQAQIKQVYFGLGQSQAQIKNTYWGLAQAQADIKAIGYGLGQAQTAVKGNAFAQAQADIKATYYGFAQAQSYIKVTDINAFAQAQADIKAVGTGLGQANADIKATSFALAQAQADIKATSNGFAQAQTDIKQTYTVFAQTQADIKATSIGLGQANADINSTIIGAFGQAQADILTQGRGVGQAQADIKAINNGLGQAQTDIKAVGYGLGQAQTDIKATYYGLGQTNADIKAVSFGLANAQADIQATYFGLANAQADIKSTYFGLAQAQTTILTTYYGFGQAQATVQGNVFGQAQADIKQSYNVYAQAQTKLIRITFARAQAAAQIGTNITQVIETYNRASETNGWGTSDQGGAWTVELGNASVYSTNGTSGQVTFPLGANSINSLRGVFHEASIGIKFTYSFDRLPTGSALTFSFDAFVASREYNLVGFGYNALVSLTATGDLSVGVYRNQAGSGTVLVAYTPGEIYEYHAIITPTDQGIYRYKVKTFKVGAIEPNWKTGFLTGAVKPRGHVNFYSGSTTVNNGVVITIDDFYVESAGWTENAQAQARIKQTYRGSGQAQAYILTTNNNVFGQAQAHIARRIVFDDFDRTLSTSEGWGTSNDGSISWGNLSSINKKSVDGSIGKVNYNLANNFYESYNAAFSEEAILQIDLRPQNNSHTQIDFSTARYTFAALINISGVAETYLSNVLAYLSPTSQNTWYTMKAFVSVSNLVASVKVWERGTPEPDWGTFYAISASFFNRVFVVTGNLDIDNFSILTLVPQILNQGIGQAQARIIAFDVNRFAQAQTRIAGDGAMVWLKDTFTRTTTTPNVGTPDIGPAYVAYGPVEDNFYINGTQLVNEVNTTRGSVDLESPISAFNADSSIEFTIPTPTPNTIVDYFDMFLSLRGYSGVALLIDAKQWPQFLIRIESFQPYEFDNFSSWMQLANIEFDTTYVIKIRAFQDRGYAKLWKKTDVEPDWMLTIAAPHTVTASSTAVLQFDLDSNNSNYYASILFDNYNITEVLNLGFGQAQASIKVFDINAYAQAGVRIAGDGALVWVKDTFTRTETGTWGTPDIGPTYTNDFSQDWSILSVNGSKGLWDNNTTNGIYASPFSQIDAYNTDHSIEFKHNDAGAANIAFAIEGRVDFGDDYHEVYASYNGSSVKVVWLDNFSGNSNTLDIPALLPNVVYVFKLRIKNNKAFAKIWEKGTTEPDWMVSVAIPSNIIGGKAYLDIGANSLSGTLNYEFDNYNITENLDLRSGQAQTSVQATYYGLGQGQAYIIIAGINNSAQAQAYIISGINQHGQTQAYISIRDYGLGQTQTWIQIIGNGLGQSQADIKNTYFGLGQSQADINQVYTQVAQAQADIKQSYIASGQAQADINATSSGYGQAQVCVKGTAFGQTQADIKATYFGSGQAQSDIKTTYYGLGQSNASILGASQKFAQAQADILQAGIGLAQAQADINQTYTQFGQASVWIKSTYYGLGQAQATVQGNAFGQTQTTVLATYTQTGQTQTWIKATYSVFGQAQVNVKAVGSGFGQANTDINATAEVFGQANADIKQVYYGLAQAQADIQTTYYGSGQAQADINATSFSLAQAQADINATYSVSGQSQADIKSTYTGLGQAQSDIKATSNVFAQAQADIKATYVGLGQTQTDIKATYTQSAQSQADINATSNGFGQAQTDIKAIGNGLGQAQTAVKGNAFGQTQADILATYYGSGQAQTWIKSVYVGLGQASASILGAYQQVAQAQADILTAGYGSGQAQADIKQTYLTFGQAQADILATYYGVGQAQVAVKGNAFAQAQADILTTYYGLGQAATWIKNTYYGLGQTQADILATYSAFGQAQTSVLATYYGLAQAQAAIKATSNGYGQTQTAVKGNAFGQTQTYIKVTDINGFGQAQTWIETTYNNFAQVNAYIKTTDNNGYGQSQADIQTTYYGLGNAQADIKAVSDGYGQAQGSILATYNSFGQAQADILATYYGLGNSQADILATSNGYGQAAANIKSTYQGFGQAQVSVKAISNGYGNAQTDVKSTYQGYGQAQVYLRSYDQNVYGQAEVNILFTGNAAFAQAQAKINAFDQNKFGQTQAQIQTTYYGLGQTQGTIKAVSSGYGNTQADVKQTYQFTGQAQSQIKQTYNSFGQANAYIKTVDNNGYGQSQTWIEITSTSYGQTQAYIKLVQFSQGQTQTYILTDKNFGLAQAQAQIRTTGAKYGQANSYIRRTETASAQAQTRIKTTYQGYGQAQTAIRVTVVGQAQTRIKQTYNAYGLAQALIRTTVIVVAQAQALIKTANTVYGQAQALIQNKGAGYGQAIALIVTTVSGFGQAQALLVKITVYGQAQALIRQLHKLKKLVVSDHATLGLVLSDRVLIDILETEAHIDLSVSDRIAIGLNLSDREKPQLSISDIEY